MKCIVLCALLFFVSNVQCEDAKVGLTSEIPTIVVKIEGDHKACVDVGKCTKNGKLTLAWGVMKDGKRKHLRADIGPELSHSRILDLDRSELSKCDVYVSFKKNEDWIDGQHIGVLSDFISETKDK